MGDGGGGHSLVQMEWPPAGWSVCLPLLIFPCTIKSRSSLLAPDHPGGPRKRAIKRLLCGGGHSCLLIRYLPGLILVTFSTDCVFFSDPVERPPKTYTTKERFEYFKPCIQVEMDYQDKLDSVTEVYIRGV